MTNPGERMRAEWPVTPVSDDAEVCACGVTVRLSDKWWHRSVCRAYQPGASAVESGGADGVAGGDVESMVEIVARAIAREEGDESRWPSYVDYARAAIRAMREPTAEMVEAGARTVWNRDALVGAYQAMIDVAGVGRPTGEVGPR